MEKKVKRILFAFLLLMTVLIQAVFVLAADDGITPPPAVKKIAVKATSETSVKVTWEPVRDADGYILVQKKEGEEEPVSVAIKKNAVTVKKMTPGVKYAFKVYSFKYDEEKDMILSVKSSPIKKVKTSIKKPAAPKGLKITQYGNLSVSISWKKVKNASGYEVYVYNTDTKSYELKGTTAENKFTVTDLTENKQYRIAVKSVREVLGATARSAASTELTPTACKVTIAEVHGRYYQSWLKYAAKVTITETGKTMTLPYNTKVFATTGTGSIIPIVLMNGTKATISRNALSFGNLAVTSNYYTRQQKELYINNRGFSSETNYLIWTNQYTLETNVFQGSKGNWKLVRSMPCVVGKYGRTPNGAFKIRHKSPNVYGYKGLYYTWNPRSGHGNAYHRRMDYQSRAAASNGCIRLGYPDLDWMYAYIPLLTTVISW